MKTKLAAALVLALLAVTASAAADPTAAASAEITALEAKFEAALAAHDRQQLEPLLADSFAWVHGSDGRVEDREGWLANAARGMALSGQRNARTEYGATLVFHGDPPHTAIRMARVRLVDSEHGREMWTRQTQTFVKAAGAWQIAMGQGVVMYDGPALDAALHARYAGTYLLDDGRRLVLAWQDNALLATLPNGTQTQIFLASPTDEVMRNPTAGALHFTLDAAGNPQSASLRRGTQDVWHAARKRD